MDLEELREAARKRSHDRCEWPMCGGIGSQLAHLHHRGMGGRPSADELDNVMWLCVEHHDILDGRQHAGLRLAQVACLQQILTYRTYIGQLLKAKAQGGQE